MTIQNIYHSFFKCKTYTNSDEWNSTTKRLNQLKEQTTELQVYITVIFLIYLSTRNKILYISAEIRGDEFGAGQHEFQAEAGGRGERFRSQPQLRPHRGTIAKISPVVRCAQN